MAVLNTITATENVSRLERELEEAREALEWAKRQPPEHALAEALHDTLCHWNHTDGCSWGYEGSRDTADWNAHAHRTYLDKARKALVAAEGDAMLVLKVLEAVK